jgi:hypothetical protein
LIHPLDKCRRKTVFLAKKNSDFFHMQTTADHADNTDEVGLGRAVKRYPGNLINTEALSSATSRVQRK